MPFQHEQVNGSMYELSQLYVNCARTIPALLPKVIRLSRSVPRSRILRRLASAAIDLLAIELTARGYVEDRQTNSKSHYLLPQATYIEERKRRYLADSVGATGQLWAQRV